ncbi:MAG: hypothetical protein FWC77_08445 [Defluviitaleaceae bacterium]|nr:hypothetical protein [Defluviitaleaceae bacterium]
MKKIVASCGVCIFTFVLFIAVTVASRRDIPAGLLDLYGDTSGIHSLTIKGEVLSWEGRYGYTFSISPEGAGTDMVIFRNSRSSAEFVFFRHWNPWFGGRFDVAYAPIEPYQVVTAESPRAFTPGPEGPIPIIEYRVYGHVFEVVPRFGSRRIYAGSTGTRGLYVDIAEGGYIFSLFREDGRFDLSPEISMQSRTALRLREEISIGDTSVFVPIGSNLFGSTAVYAVRMPRGYAPTIQVPPNDTFKVTAEVLLPVTLERGVDTIHGLIQLEDDALLFIQRAGGLELTRICPVYGKLQEALIEGPAVFHEYYLHEDSLVLHGFEEGGPGRLIAAVDLRNRGLAVTDVFLAALGMEGNPQPGETFVDAHDMLLREGVIYIAYSVTPTEMAFPIVEENIFISAFDREGRLIGRSQVLSGVEDDRFWAWELSFRHFRDSPPLSQRRLQLLTIHALSSDTANAQTCAYLP